MNNDKSNNPIDNNYQYSTTGLPQQAAYPPASGGGPKKLIKIVIMLAVFVLVTGAIYLVQQNKINSLNSQITSLKNPAGSGSDKDKERQADIKALATIFEAYSANGEGYYPTFASMNDSTWIETNLTDLNKEATRDPAGTSYKFLTSSTAGQYGYAPSQDDGKACNDTVGNVCTKFTLTYTTDDGNQHKVTNL